MANSEGHRRSGSVRRRESGRYQVRYPGPDGRLRSAPRTFTRKADAERYLSLVEAQMIRGEWVDPSRGAVRLGDYAATWIEQRPNLRPRTVDLYRWLLAKHLAPQLSGVPVAEDRHADGAGVAGDAAGGRRVAVDGGEGVPAAACGPDDGGGRGFNKAAGWRAAVNAIGVPGLHFHDLRHTGNTLAAQTPGVSLKDLMARMGHDNVRAAIIYQHATADVDRAIADALSARVDAERPPAPDRTAGQDPREGDGDDGAADALMAAG